MGKVLLRRRGEWLLRVKGELSASTTLWLHLLLFGISSIDVSSSLMLYRLALQEEARKKQELVKEAEEMSTKQVISSLAI